MAYEGGKHEEDFKVLRGGCTQSVRDRIVSNLITQYTPLIHKTAHEYSTLDFSAAKSAALKGFMDGIKKYDPELGADFAYIAKKYMKSACQKAYRDDRAIHIPHNVIAQIEKVTRLGLTEKDRADMTEEEITLLDEVEDIIPTMNCSTLDAPVKGSQIGSEMCTMADVFSQDTFDAPDHSYYLSEVEGSLRRLLDKLPTDEKMALIHFNGLFGEEEKTTREVGALIGLSPQGAINKRKRAELRLMELALETEKELVETYSLEGIR